MTKLQQNWSTFISIFVFTDPFTISRLLVVPVSSQFFYRARWIEMKWTLFSFSSSPVIPQSHRSAIPRRISRLPRYVVNSAGSERRRRTRKTGQISAANLWNNLVVNLARRIAARCAPLEPGGSRPRPFLPFPFETMEESFTVALDRREDRIFSPQRS